MMLWSKFTTSHWPKLRNLLAHPRSLWLAPVLPLLAFWLAGEAALVETAVALSVLFLLAGRSKRAPSQQTTDALTGLPSAKDLKKDASERMSALQTTEAETALCLLDLQDMGTLHQATSPPMARFILERIAARLQRQSQASDKIYALDETRFAVLSELRSDFPREDALQLAARLQTLAEEPLVHETHPLIFGCTVGVSLSQDIPKQTGESLLRGAELALKEALEQGASSIRLYNARIERDAQRFETLTKEAQSAFCTGEIRAYFQPQIRTDTSELTGLEALARWVHPKYGVLTPADFFPALQAAGVMQDLSRHMLTTAIESLSAWDAEGLDVPSCAVNLDDEDLSDPALPDKLLWELDRHGLSPSRITLEVLETVAVNTGEDKRVKSLKRLSQLGCRIDLDDFGIGHGALDAVRHLGADRIKLDRSFISQLDKNPDLQRMVQALQSMADRLGMETLAEGVETQAEQDALAALGCLTVQGYGVAPPMPFSECSTWIANHTARHRALSGAQQAAQASK